MNTKEQSWLAPVGGVVDPLFVCHAIFPLSMWIFKNSQTPRPSVLTEKNEKTIKIETISRELHVQCIPEHWEVAYFPSFFESFRYVKTICRKKNKKVQITHILKNVSGELLIRSTAIYLSGMKTLKESWHPDAWGSLFNIRVRRRFRKTFRESQFQESIRSRRRSAPLSPSLWEKCLQWQCIARAKLNDRSLEGLRDCAYQGIITLAVAPTCLL